MKANLTATFIIGFSVAWMMFTNHNYMSTILLGIGLALITIRLMMKPYPDEEEE
ncbi:hypothetical protein LB941_06375 [Ligilactobacillus sp. WILCCON 0076]|uniref:Uncharacterized protein n=1 Tax=Ligilactobacillus ubinensis TaxID=2876789 RepID=A0A9X2FLY0_9LACO|nr:hypothetical protein [Ligilactobacillus ubinensis]MCP0886958.1 hypothetical protein [Ligilactobacillus ubinensis]